MQPKISIVTVSYNQAEYLSAAIDSVLDQNYPNLEYIVIDGGSTDASVEIIKSYEKKIDYWLSEPDEGQSEALNKGFARTTGDIVSWLNSDDTYNAGTFDAVAAAFRDCGVQIAMSEAFAYMQSDGIVYSKGTNAFLDHDTLVRFWRSGGMTVNQPCVFFRRKLFEKVGGRVDEDLHLAMDYDLWLRLTQHAPIKIVPGTWANYRMHGSSKSGQGFHYFLPEWKHVSRRFWGKWYTLSFYRFFFDYLFSLLSKVKNKQTSSYPPPVFDFNAGFRIRTDNPQVSVIITNYNYERYLEAAIQSVLDQNYERVEVLVVDDGSTDESRQSIEKFRGKIKPVFKENGGQASAFNAGVAQAAGDIICFLDADDTWKPEKITQVVKKFSKAPWGLICHDLRLIDENGKENTKDTFSSFYENVMESGTLFDTLAHNGFPWVFSPTSGMSLPSKLARRIFPLPEDPWRISADCPLAYAAAYLAPVGVIHEPLGCYRVHSSNLFFDPSHGNSQNRRAMGITHPLTVEHFLRSHFKELQKTTLLDPKENYWFFRSWCLVTTRHPALHLPALYRKCTIYFLENPHLVPPSLIPVQLFLDTAITLAIEFGLPIRHKEIRKNFRTEMASFDDLKKQLVLSQKRYFNES